MAQADPKSRPAGSRRLPPPPAAARRRPKRPPVPRAVLSPDARRCRAKFLRYFRKGFYGPLYVDWERGYKWDAHRRWTATLDRETFQNLLVAGRHREIAARAVAI